MGYNVLRKENEDMEKLSSDKLIVVETDCHGCGYICYKGETRYYSYDDGENGDLCAAIRALIDIGFISEEDVLFFDGVENLLAFVSDLIKED